MGGNLLVSGSVKELFSDDIEGIFSMITDYQTCQHDPSMPHLSPSLGSWVLVESSNETWRSFCIMPEGILLNVGHGIKLGI